MLTTDDVNLRSGPGTGFDVIALVPAGTEVATGAKHENGFLPVTLANQSGWIAADYLRAPENNGPSVQAAEMQETTAEAPVPTAAPTWAPVVGETTQVQADPQPGEHWIEVSRTDRTVTLHNGEIVVAQFDALIGKDLAADGYYSTAIGTYHVHIKEKALVETPFADGVYLTDFVGFDPVRSNGFHSPVRDANGNVVVTGGTATLGCVRLSEADAITLFEFATIGMRVEVHD